MRPEDSSEEEVLARAAALTPEYTYRDFLRLKVGDYYDFARHEEPFGPVFSKLTIDPGGQMLFDVELAYNMYLQAADRFNVILTLGEKRKNHLMLRYRYDRDTRRGGAQPGIRLRPDHRAGKGHHRRTRSTRFYIHAQKSVTERAVAGRLLFERDFINDTDPLLRLGVHLRKPVLAPGNPLRARGAGSSLGIRLTLFGIGDFGL